MSYSNNQFNMQNTNLNKRPMSFESALKQNVKILFILNINSQLENNISFTNNNKNLYKKNSKQNNNNNNNYFNIEESKNLDFNLENDLNQNKNYKNLNEIEKKNSNIINKKNNIKTSKKSENLLKKYQNNLTHFLQTHQDIKLSGNKRFKDKSGEYYLKNISNSEIEKNKKSNSNLNIIDNKNINLKNIKKKN